MLTLKQLVGLFCMVAAGYSAAHSGSDVTVPFGSISITNNGRNESIPVFRQTASVRFDIASSDIGRPGQLLLVYQTSLGELGVLTQTGWEPFVTGLATPLVNTESLDPTYTIVFFDSVYFNNGQQFPSGEPFVGQRYYGYGSSHSRNDPANYRSVDYSRLPGTVINARLPNYETSTLCGSIRSHGYGSGTLYAAYGALQPEAEERIRSFESIQHTANSPTLSPEHFRNVFIELDGREGKKYNAVLALECD